MPQLYDANDVPLDQLSSPLDLSPVGVSDGMLVLTASGKVGSPGSGWPPQQWVRVVFALGVGDGTLQWTHGFGANQYLIALLLVPGQPERG
jgi:hypothetical protein